MDVNGTSPGMRPEAVVDLISGNKPTGHGRGLPEQGPSSAASSSLRSPTEVTWRSGFTISVPTPRGPTQCSTSQESVLWIRPPGSSRAPRDSSQATQSVTQTFFHRPAGRCAIPDRRLAINIWNGVRPPAHTPASGSDHALCRSRIPQPATVEGPRPAPSNVSAGGTSCRSLMVHPDQFDGPLSPPRGSAASYGRLPWWVMSDREVDRAFRPRRRPDRTRWHRLTSGTD
jgi:hypothetical protein